MSEFYLVNLAFYFFIFSIEIVKGFVDLFIQFHKEIFRSLSISFWSYVYDTIFTEYATAILKEGPVFYNNTQSHASKFNI